MKKQRIFNLMGLMLIMMSACTTASKSTGQWEDLDFKQAVEERLGSPLDYVYNTTKNKVLCINHTDQGKAPRKEIKFLVWDLEGADVLYESSIDGGKVGWFDDNHLEVFRIPGIVRSGESMDKYVKIINVNSSSTRTKEDFLKSKDL